MPYITLNPAAQAGKEQKMHNKGAHRRGYVLAAVLGAMGGGLVVALATKAIPKVISQMMSGMMQNMMAQMGEGGCDPAEM
jgi:CheY-specific phosphatase CheX